MSQSDTMASVCHRMVIVWMILCFEWQALLSFNLNIPEKKVEDFDAISSSQDEIQQSLDYFYNEHAPSKGKRKDLGNWRGSHMVSFELPNGDLFFFVVNEQDKPLMYLAVAPFRESYAVGNVRKTKGDGFYASDMYEWLVE